MKFNRNIALQVLMLLQVGQVVAMNRETAEYSAELVGNALGGSLGGSIAKNGVKQAIDLVNDPRAMENLQKTGEEVLHQASKQADELKEDSATMFHSYKTSLFGVKDPLIGAIAAGLVMQKKSEKAKEFKKQAVSAYYPYGLISFITGTAFVVAAPFSKSSKELAMGGFACLATSYGCFYKSRSDLITLKNKIVREASSSK